MVSLRAEDSMPPLGLRRGDSRRVSQGGVSNVEPADALPAFESATDSPSANHGEVVMFSERQKREIAKAVQKILRATNHRELPEGEIQFKLHVQGAHSASWANILNNGAVLTPGNNPHNEVLDTDLEAVQRGEAAMQRAMGRKRSAN
jgi:hypothetical protein